MLIVTTSRAVVTDDEGSVTVDFDAPSGAIFVEFERFESEDAILLNYRVSLSTEHVLAWIESMLSTLGRRCRRMDGDGSKKRLSALLSLTARDPSLVFLSAHGAHIALVRDGRVLKTAFALESMGGFLSRLREPSHETTTTATAFAAYIRGLMMCPLDAQRSII